MISIDPKDFTIFMDSIKSKQTAETGLFIGYKYQDRYYVYLISKTPAAEASHKQVSALLGLNLPTPDAVYSDWVLQHATEVSRFLPGGLRILGLYSVAEEALRLENFASIPSSIIKVCSDLTQEITKETNLLFLHYNILEQKYCAGNLDIEVRGSQNKSFAIGEVKTTALPKLEEVRCLYRMEIEVRCEGTTQSLMQEILKIC